MIAAATVAQALAGAVAQGLERADAQDLLAHVLHQNRAWLLAHGEASLDENQHSAFIRFCQRRAAGEPYAYLTGLCEFHGLPLRVNPAVLVPRPDTETLVDWALDLLTGELAGGLSGQAAPAVADLGTGSGAVALAIRHRCPKAQLTATDLSADALAVARANAERLRLPLRLLRGDWLAALAGQRFDLIVSNPPYIAEADPHLAALRHEPALALIAGCDGLAALRRIAAQAAAHLHGGGWLLLEHGWDQAGAVRALLDAAGFGAVCSRRDLAGRWRCSGGRWPS